MALLFWIFLSGHLLLALCLNCYWVCYVLSCYILKQINFNLFLKSKFFLILNFLKVCFKDNVEKAKEMLESLTTDRLDCPFRITTVTESDALGNHDTVDQVVYDVWVFIVDAKVSCEL